MTKHLKEDDDRSDKLGVRTGSDTNEQKSARITIQEKEQHRGRRHSVFEREFRERKA